MTQQPPEAATETPTPRTDAVHKFLPYGVTHYDYSDYCALADLAWQLERELAAAQAALAAAKGGWMPIDSAPKDGTRIITGHTEWRTSWEAQWRFHRGVEGWYREHGGDRVFPSHWQPIPPPPTTHEP